MIDVPERGSRGAGKVVELVDEVAVGAVEARAQLQEHKESAQDHERFHRQWSCYGLSPIRERVGQGHTLSIPGTRPSRVRLTGEKPNRTSRWHSLSPPQSNTHARRRTGLSLRPPVSTLPVLGARRPLFKQGLEARMVAERIQIAVLPEPLDVGESAADGFLDALQGPIEVSGQ